MRSLIYIVCITMLLPCLVLARPVSYPSGITLMQMNDTDTNSIHIHYSPTARYSIGYRGEYWRDEKWQFHGLQLNNLLKRWNKPASQSNFYIKSGIGINNSHNSENDFAAFAGVSLDSEDRRFFTSYENRLYKAGDNNRFFTQKARIGVAPYIGDYGDLHTWLILQIDHSPEKDDPATITSIIRLFKGEYLAEVGVNEDGDTVVNFIVRL